MDRMSGLYISCGNDTQASFESAIRHAKTSVIVPGSTGYLGITTDNLGNTASAATARAQ